MFIGSLSAFELDKLLGSVWPGVSMMGTEKERSHIFLNKVNKSFLLPWFSEQLDYCAFELLPAFYNKVPPMQYD